VFVSHYCFRSRYELTAFFDTLENTHTMAEEEPTYEDDDEVEEMKRRVQEMEVKNCL